MRFITCASYYGVGSSAVTDLVSEYSAITDYSNFEFRFLQDPDGISDLEYNLIENHNRHNSGHALKRYKKLVEFYNGNLLAKKYRSFFGEEWINLSYKYIDDLTDFKFHGSWMYDFYDKGKFFYYRKMLINKILKKTIWKKQPDRQYNALKNEWTLCSHPSYEKFLNLTKKYIEDLFTKNKSNTEYVMVDQIVPPTNLKRYIRYFNDIKIIVVDRDPRDLWTLEKYVWKDGVIPHEDVETFCKWYKYTRNHRKYDDLNNQNIMFIRFEDMIYNYENCVENIEKFIGLQSKNHSSPKSKFIPEKSIKNTQVWKRLPNVKQEDIVYIENELKEYIYNNFTEI